MKILKEVPRPDRYPLLTFRQIADEVTRPMPVPSKIQKKYIHEMVRSDPLNPNKFELQYAYKKIKALGVIVDATGPYQGEECFEVRIKLIDHTFNPSLSKESPEKQFIQIKVYTQEYKDAINVISMGDILYLKRFDFIIDAENDQIIGYTNMVSKGGYYLFNGYEKEFKSDFAVFQSDTFAQFGPYMPKEDLKKKIVDLRAWSNEYFRKNSLIQTIWKDYLPLNIKQEEKQNFDMILKLKQQIRVNDEYDIMSYVYTDSSQQEFYIQFRNQNLSINQFNRIRSVEEILPNQVLVLANQGQISEIPSYFSSDIQKCKDFTYKVDFFIKQFVKEYKGGDELFDFSDQTKLSFVQKQYGNYEITALSTLLNLQQRFKQGDLEFEDLQDKIYKVKGYICNTIPNQFYKAAFLYNPRKNEIIPFEKETLLQNGDLYPLWQFVFQIKDDSIENEAQIFNLFVFTFDNNPINLIPEIDFKGELSNNEKVYDDFVHDLEYNTSLNSQCDFIVKPLIHPQQPGTMVYRLIDTKFKTF